MRLIHYIWASNLTSSWNIFMVLIRDCRYRISICVVESSKRIAVSYCVAWKCFFIVCVLQNHYKICFYWDCVCGWDLVFETCVTRILFLSTPGPSRRYFSILIFLAFARNGANYKTKCADSFLVSFSQRYFHTKQMGASQNTKSTSLKKTWIFSGFSLYLELVTHGFL